MSQRPEEAPSRSIRSAEEEDMLPPPAFLPGLPDDIDEAPSGDDASGGPAATEGGFRRAGDLDASGVAALLERMAGELRSDRALATWPGPEAGALEAALRGLVAGYLLARDPRAESPGA